MFFSALGLPATPTITTVILKGRSVIATKSHPALLCYFLGPFSYLDFFFFEVPPLSSCEVLDSVCILCPKEPHHLLHPQLDSLLLPLYGSAVIPSPHPAHHLRLWCVFTFTSIPSAFEPVSLSKPYYLWSLLPLEAGGRSNTTDPSAPLHLWV